MPASNRILEVKVKVFKVSRIIQSEFNVPWGSPLAISVSPFCFVGGWSSFDVCRDKTFLAGDLLFPLLLEFSLEFDEPWDPVRLFFLGVLPSFFLVLLLIQFRVIMLQEPISHLPFLLHWTQVFLNLFVKNLKDFLSKNQRTQTKI